MTSSGRLGEIMTEKPLNHRTIPCCANCKHADIMFDVCNGCSLHGVDTWFDLVCDDWEKKKEL